MNNCKYCKRQITIETENREDSMGQGAEWDIEAGHQIGCRYYNVEAQYGREQVDKIYNAPMPKLNIPRLTVEEREERYQSYGR